VKTKEDFEKELKPVLEQLEERDAMMLTSILISNLNEGLLIETIVNLTSFMTGYRGDYLCD
jgi:hypothetical protein